MNTPPVVIDECCGHGDDAASDAETVLAGSETSDDEGSDGELPTAAEGAKGKEAPTKSKLVEEQACQLARQLSRRGPVLMGIFHPSRSCRQGRGSQGLAGWRVGGLAGGRVCLTRRTGVRVCVRARVCVRPGECKGVYARANVRTLVNACVRACVQEGGRAAGGHEYGRTAGRPPSEPGARVHVLARTCGRAAGRYSYVAKWMQRGAECQTCCRGCCVVIRFLFILRIRGMGLHTDR